MTVAHIDELEAYELPDGFVWRPVRRRFGIEAFGVNAYTPGASGQVVEEHTEELYGHEELYVVLRGRVRFAVGDYEHELRAGQLVFVRDPQLRRSATALSDDAAVLAVGGKPGQAHEVSAWETLFVATPAIKAGDWDAAIRIHQEALDERPDDPQLLFNLACMEARGGQGEDALRHLQRAVGLDPSCAAAAATDSDFDTIRDAAGFPGGPA